MMGLEKLNLFNIVITQITKFKITLRGFGSVSFSDTEAIHRQAHNLKVAGSNPASATKYYIDGPQLSVEPFSIWLMQI